MTLDDLPPACMTVDGLEGTQARVELPDGSTEVWSLASLPKGVQEGEIVRLTVTGGDLDMEIDHARTRAQSAASSDALDALNAGAPSGDVDL